MLQIYNTMTRRKEMFKPRNDGMVKMFSCGPSIYGRPHIGNYRSFLWQDVFQRYLEWKGYRVERVVNLTDVEDKALAEAEKEGMTVRELTEKNSEQFFSDMKLLRIKLPDFIPRSSTSVGEAVKLIKILLEKGIAYWYEGDVFFDPLKVRKFGRLFRLDMNRWPAEKRRFKQDTYPGRRWNLGDFILWHGRKKGEGLFWDTEIGKGRPAWNIQDPAMISQHLGYTIDIACGGIDNLYRHHDYNIAVMEAVSGEELAHYWVHGEHLLVNGKKMSKSVGNIIYPEDLIAEGFSPQHIRFCLIYGNHRKRINLTVERFREKSSRLDALRNMVREISCSGEGNGGREESSGRAVKLVDNLLSVFEKHMDDDLDVKGAFDSLYRSLLDLAVLNHDGKLGHEDCRRVAEALHELDEVFRVIFED